jgi:hypothetical protein
MTPDTPTDAMGMSMSVPSAPDSTLFSMVSVFVSRIGLYEYVRPDPLSSTRAVIWSWMACGMPVRIMMDACMAALAGSPHGRISAPMEKVIEGTSVNEKPSLEKVTAGELNSHVLVPPTPDSAGAQEQPSASGRSGSTIPQTVLVESSAVDSVADSAVDSVADSVVDSVADSVAPVVSSDGQTSLKEAVKVVNVIGGLPTSAFQSPS